MKTLSNINKHVLSVGDKYGLNSFLMNFTAVHICYCIAYDHPTNLKIFIRILMHLLPLGCTCTLYFISHCNLTIIRLKIYSVNASLRNDIFIFCTR